MMNDRDYIKDRFENDGVKAPESLSEDNILKMLEAEDAKDKIVTFDADESSEKTAQEYKPRKVRKLHLSPKRVISVAAVLLVAVLGISGLYNVMTSPPDTSLVGGELYTFKSNSEIKNTVKSLDNSSGGPRLLKKNDIVEYYGEDTMGDAEVYESYDAAEPKSLDSQSPAAGSSGDTSHSETYLQVADVDESDIVRTDGKYIYYVNDNEEVVILEAKDGKTKRVGTIGSSGVENYVHDIYLKGDTLITVGRFYDEDDEEGRSGIVVYDISNRSKPEMVSYFSQSGEVVTSRMVGDNVYLITEEYVYYQNEHYIPRCGHGKDYNELAPSDICCVPSPKTASYVILSAIDINSGENSKSKTKAIFGATDEVYCNDHNLYAVAREWEGTGNNEYTRVSRASLDGLNVKFNGTVRVRGYVINRFAMDEKDGYFRIATTSTRDGMDVNNLYVLGSDFKETGKVTGFARNESIKAVRYIGSKAYVITYEAIDPLFVIDLKDPAAPRIEGEVKIDGFSTLLIPVGKEKLLGIGHATGDNGYGGEFDSGLKLALFDISDPSQPKVLDSKEFENMTSPAQDDSHALTVNTEAGWFAIPYEIYRDVDDADGVVEIEDDVVMDSETYEEEDVIASEPENEYEDGVLVFKADGKLGPIDKHALGSEYIARSVYIDDYIYALDRDGNCSSFRPEF